MKKINYYRITQEGLGTYLKSTDVYKGTKKGVKHKIKKLQKKYGKNYYFYYEKME